MGLFFIHPPQEYLKKSTQGSMLRSMEVTSSAGSCWGAGDADCCALATESSDATASARNITEIKKRDITIYNLRRGNLEITLIGTSINKEKLVCQPQLNSGGEVNSYPAQYERSVLEPSDKWRS